LYALTQLRCCGTYFGDLVPAYGEKSGLNQDEKVEEPSAGK